MSPKPRIRRPRRDCQIQARGHHPNHIQVLRLALPQRDAAPRVHTIGVAEFTDQLGTVGRYELHLDDGSERTVFDHDPARLRQLLTAHPGQDPVLTPAGILWIGSYAVSVADAADLDSRSPCGASPWPAWLAGDSDEPPPSGGFLLSVSDLLRDDPPTK
jgi:hypothetical protein